MVTLELGGNISLSGFSDRDFTEMIVVKKMVGQYARKLTDHVQGFSKLSITLKDVHAVEGHGRVEITTKVDVDGHSYAAETEGHNLFIVLDEGLKRVMEQIQQAQEKHIHTG